MPRPTQPYLPEPSLYTARTGVQPSRGVILFSHNNKNKRKAARDGLPVPRRARYTYTVTRDAK